MRNTLVKGEEEAYKLFIDINWLETIFKLRICAVDDDYFLELDAFIIRQYISGLTYLSLKDFYLEYIFIPRNLIIVSILLLNENDDNNEFFILFNMLPNHPS